MPKRKYLEGRRQSSQQGGSRFYSCLVPRFSAQWFLSMDQSASLCDGLPAADVLFHSRREKTRCTTATLNRSHSSKFIAYLEAPQHRNSGFPAYAEEEKTPCPKTTVTPYPIREGIFSLSDPISFPPKIFMLGSHRTHHQAPIGRQVHTGRQQ